MFAEVEYNRRAAVSYALKWAFARNPRFYDFTDIGGDCTNFISQCLYAGCGVMNYSQTDGWYYISTDDRSPSWTGVVFLREFLLSNDGAGVYGETAELSELSAGDVIQLADSGGRLYHSLIISAIFPPYTPDDIFICAHSDDARNRRLSSYGYAEAEGIHILGARKELSF